VIVAADDEAQQVSTGELALLADNTRVSVRGAEDGSGFLYLSAAPHNEPIVRGGPFVMNTEEEIRRAFLDYQSGKLF
jgi:redox-sensitive bicupin YhaK (pirin superfamily)